MNPTIHFVVGDDYANFASHNSDVICASEMLRQLDNPLLWSGPHKVLLGQGIDESTRLALAAACRACQIDDLAPVEELAPTQLTHKHYRDNVLISAPQNLAVKCYQFELMLGAQIDRLSDHVTGQHVGAMLLMEAARQAVVVSLECEYSRHSETSLGFVLERFNSRFDNYTFPLPTAMTVTLLERHGPQSKNVAVSLTIVFQQAGQQVSEMVLDVSLFPTEMLSKIEARKAKKSLDVLRAQALVVTDSALQPA